MDINTFFDYDQCKSIGSFYSLDKENKNYYKSRISELSGSLFECKIPAEPIELHVNDSYDNFRIYGLKNIELLIEKAITSVCHHTPLSHLLVDLRDRVQPIVRGYRASTESIKEIEHIAAEIEGLCKEIDCDKCNVEQCYKLIQKVKIGIPYFEYVLGTFESPDTINLYLLSIHNSSGSAKDFNEEYWSTLTHEIFHAYHYFFFAKHSRENYWTEKEWENRWEDKSLKREDEDEIIEYRRDQDTRIEGYQSDLSIVKESLASFYEYCYLWEKGTTSPICKKSAEILRKQWYIKSPAIWPYAGARAFDLWGMAHRDYNYNENTLFKQVLKESLTDWKVACDLILENLGKTVFTPNQAFDEPTIN